jgi:hypothetical protein
MSRRTCEILYRDMPDSTQVQNLHSAIKASYKQRADERATTAVAVGATAVGLTAVAVGLGLLFSRKR